MCVLHSALDTDQEQPLDCDQDLEHTQGSRIALLQRVLL